MEKDNDEVSSDSFSDEEKSEVLDVLQLSVGDEIPPEVVTVQLYPVCSRYSLEDGEVRLTFGVPVTVVERAWIKSIPWLPVVAGGKMVGVVPRNFMKISKGFDLYKKLPAVNNFGTNSIGGKIDTGGVDVKFKTPDSGVGENIKNNVDIVEKVRNMDEYSDGFLMGMSNDPASSVNWQIPPRGDSLLSGDNGNIGNNVGVSKIGGDASSIMGSPYVFNMSNPYSPYSSTVQTMAERPKLIFSGKENIVDFFHKLELIYNHDGNILRSRLEIHLDGNASFFFELIKNGRTYNQIKDEMKRYFGNLDNVFNMLEKVVFGGEKDTILGYYGRLNRIFQVQEHLTEEQKLFYFRRGISKFGWLFNKVDYIENFEELVKKTGILWERRVRSNSPRNTGSNYGGATNNNLRTVKCYKCGEMGHYQNSCPKVTAKSDGDGSEDKKVDPGSAVSCYKCGKLGHVKSQCPNSSILVLLPKDTVQNSNTLDETLAIYINLEISGKIVKCLVDPGSPYSIMDNTTSEYLGEVVAATKQIRGYSNQFVKLGGVANVIIGEREFKTYVDSEVPFPFILGRNIFLGLEMELKGNKGGFVNVIVGGLNRPIENPIISKERWRTGAWKINPRYLKPIFDALPSVPQLDMFADDVNTQCAYFCSASVTYGTLGNALELDWARLQKIYGLLYINAPFDIMLQVVTCIKKYGIQAIIFFPEFVNSSWWLPIMDIIGSVFTVIGKKQDLFFPQETNYQHGIGSPYFNTWICYVDGSDTSTEIQTLDPKRLRNICFRCKNFLHRTKDCPNIDRINEVKPSTYANQTANVTIQATDTGVVLVEPVTIPSRSFKEVLLKDVKLKSEENILLLETINSKDNLLMANSLIDIDNPVVGMTNVGDKDIVLDKGFRIGSVSKCVRFQDSEIEKMRINLDGGYNVDDAVLAIDDATPVIEQIESNLKNVGLEEGEKRQLRQLLLEFGDIISLHNFDVGRVKDYKFEIELSDYRPSRIKSNRVSKTEEEMLLDMKSILLKYDLIRASKSPWSHRVVLVAKKGSDVKRFCVDYSPTNKKTIGDAYPLPRIDSILDFLGGNMYFSTLDLTQGYWQVEIKEEHKKYTAFQIKDELFEWNRLPFGLTNAPAGFQRLMNLIMGGLTYEQCLIYLDDLIVFSKSFDDHLGHIRNVLVRFRENGMKVKLHKCDFFAQSLDYLGFRVDIEGIKPSDSKIQALRTYKEPSNIKQVQRFLGFVNYYRTFIENFALITQPFAELLKSNATFIWEEVHKQSFDKLVVRLSEYPILAFPCFDKQFVLTTDASGTAFGGYLSQEYEDGIERIISYYSRSFKGSQLNWDTAIKEAYSVFRQILFFKHYLWGVQFVVRTDNIAVVSLLKKPGNIPKVNTWRLKIQDFTYEIMHKKGSENVIADALSRSLLIKDVDDKDLISLIKYWQQTDAFCVLIRQQIFEQRKELAYFINDSGIIARHSTLSEVESFQKKLSNFQPYNALCKVLCFVLKK